MYPARKCRCRDETTPHTTPRGSTPTTPTTPALEFDDSAEDDVEQGNQRAPRGERWRARGYRVTNPASETSTPKQLQQQQRHNSRQNSHHRSGYRQRVTVVKKVRKADAVRGENAGFDQVQMFHSLCFAHGCRLHAVVRVCTLLLCTLVLVFMFVCTATNSLRRFAELFVHCSKLWYFNLALDFYVLGCRLHRETTSSTPRHNRATLLDLRIRTALGRRPAIKYPACLLCLNGCICIVCMHQVRPACFCSQCQPLKHLREEKSAHSIRNTPRKLSISSVLI